MGVVWRVLGLGVAGLICSMGSFLGAGVEGWVGEGLMGGSFEDDSEGLQGKEKGGSFANVRGLPVFLWMISRQVRTRRR